MVQTFFIENVFCIFKAFHTNRLLNIPLFSYLITWCQSIPLRNTLPTDNHPKNSIKSQYFINLWFIYDLIWFHLIKKENLSLFLPDCVSQLCFIFSCFPWQKIFLLFSFLINYFLMFLGNGVGGSCSECLRGFIEL